MRSVKNTNPIDAAVEAIRRDWGDTEYYSALGANSVNKVRWIRSMSIPLIVHSDDACWRVSQRTSDIISVGQNEVHPYWEPLPLP